MDVLAGGRDAPPSRIALLLARLPARAVAPALLAVLTAGVVAVGEVRQAVREADDVSQVEVRLVVEQARRAGDGSAFGSARLEVSDPGGRQVVLQDLDVDVPGLRLGSQGSTLDQLEAAPRLVLPLRFAVPDCDELVLPGRLRALLARPGGVPALVTADDERLADDVGTPLRRLCGVPELAG